MKYFLLILLLIPGLWFCTDLGEPQKQPNILIVLADDLGYSDLGCYGGEIETPGLDELGLYGLRFTQFTNSSRCCPSRASLMTGLYPHLAGIGSFTTPKPDQKRGPAYIGRLSDKSVTIAQVLKSNGYGTYMVGKWHLHNETGPIERGFNEFYGYTWGHSHNQWDSSKYFRLPVDQQPELKIENDEFYATDVFNNYSLEFLQQAAKKDKPWFLYLAHSSPHFPIQAPRESIDKYVERYSEGWDILREKRFDRMSEMGLAEEDWKLTEKSIVPVESKDAITNFFGGKPNPDWNEIDPDRQKDLIYRMATYAAMVDHVDQGIQKIISFLKESGQFENTIIMFTSDNGACYEWGPWGFDMPDDGRRGTRLGINTLHKGDSLLLIGGKETFQSYGSGWTNLSNTPFQMYKHFTHEGGMTSPFIVHWPKGITNPGEFVRSPAHIMDIMPTICEVSGSEYPTEMENHKIIPVSGVSLRSFFRDNTKKMDERPLFYDHQGAYAMREGKWKIVRSKRMPAEIFWELYDLELDRTETTDIAEKYPEVVDRMKKKWFIWAEEVGVYEYEEAK